MSFFSSRAAMFARSAGRALGVNRLLAKLWLSSGYEDRYDQMLAAEIQPSDCVWDVGANVGYYTKSFAEKVGEGGVVFCFEPSPLNYAVLEREVGERENVSLLRLALGSFSGKAAFAQGQDDLGATSRVGVQVSSSIEVDVEVADTLIEDGRAQVPNIIKIDVEGFELEVLEGMQGTLRKSPVRAVGIELHFGILQSRGIGFAPRKIEAMLTELGFSVKWADPSHIVGRRN